MSGIHFQNCVYQLDGCNLIQMHIKSQTGHSDILFMTFRTNASMNTKDKRVLLSSHSGRAEIFREIRVDSTGIYQRVIKIHRSKRKHAELRNRKE